MHKGLKKFPSRISADYLIPFVTYYTGAWINTKENIFKINIQCLVSCMLQYNFLLNILDYTQDVFSHNLRSNFLKIPRDLAKTHCYAKCYIYIFFFLTFLFIGTTFLVQPKKRWGYMLCYSMQNKMIQTFINLECPRFCTNTIIIYCEHENKDYE